MKKAFSNVVCLLLLLLILSLLVETTLSAPRNQVVEMQCGRDREANTSIFTVNFVAAMENISEQVRTTGFGETVVGTGPNANFGLAQCYGDLTLTDCVLCYAEMRTLFPQCYPSSAGRLYLDGCYVRVTNYSFYEEFTGPDDKAVCGNATRKSTKFQESARRAVSDAAATAPGNGGYARSEVLVSGPANESAYVLANCWRSLNSSSCKACLDNAVTAVIGCLPWSEGRALNTGCFMRYSDIDFLNEEQQSSSGPSKVKIIVIVVVVASALVLLAIAAAITNYTRKQKRIQKKRKGATEDTAKMAKILNDSSLNFKFSVLQKATGSFDEANRLGQGGFGTVYKGVLADGREIAVKRLFVNNKHRAADFYNEVNIISSVEHKNLVRLLGCNCSGPESLLVYEFLPNKSLDRFLFAFLELMSFLAPMNKTDPNRGKALYWEKRFEIAIGTAEGLAYLHENPKNRIIHRDIKASNILLDSKLRAKIADFGLARSFQEDKSHISTAIAGTLGYMAPEYLAHGQLTEKADVYSFGVLLLEIVTGRQNNRSKTLDYSDSLITAAWKHFQLGTAEELFDPNLMLHNYNNESDMKKDILRVVHVGLLCTQEIPSLRPFMERTIEMLLNKDHILPAPTNPPFIDESTMELNDNSSNPSNPLNATSSPSVANMSHSSFYPR